MTISGPPARLRRLFRMSDFFRDRTFVALPVYGGLCHAKHIYNSQHARSVVQGPSIAALDTRFIARYPILSTGSGEPFPTATTATELFEHVMTEILTQAIEWENVIQGVVERAKLLSVSEVQVQVFRNSHPVHDLLSALETSLRKESRWLSRTSAHGSQGRETRSGLHRAVRLNLKSPSSACPVACPVERLIRRNSGTFWNRGWMSIARSLGPIRRGQSL